MYSPLAKYKTLTPLFGFSVGLLFIRIVLTQSFMFTFLLWNLFLSLVPLYFSHWVHGSSNKNKQYASACLWLLFFPNSTYIITDLFHFYERPPIAPWYDLIFLFSAAVNGLIAGYLSLNEIELWLRKQIADKWIKPILAGLLLISAFGVYLGRYLRFNSWDILLHPFRLGRGIASHICYPANYFQSWLLTIIFGLWFYLLYNGLKKWKKI